MTILGFDQKLGLKVVMHLYTQHIFRHLACEYMYLYHFLAKNVRHFGFGSLALLDKQLKRL